MNSSPLHVSNSILINPGPINPVNPMNPHKRHQPHINSITPKPHNPKTQNTKARLFNVLDPPREYASRAHGSRRCDFPEPSLQRNSATAGTHTSAFFIGVPYDMPQRFDEPSYTETPPPPAQLPFSETPQLQKRRAAVSAAPLPSSRCLRNAGAEGA